MSRTAARRIIEPIVRGQIRDLVHHHADYLTAKGLSNSHGHTLLEASLADRIINDLVSRVAIMRLTSVLCLKHAATEPPAGLGDAEPAPPAGGASLPAGVRRGFRRTLADELDWNRHERSEGDK